MPREAGMAVAEEAAEEHPFAPFIRTLGRGPGRSRALTREEAREALGMVLRRQVDPHQVGAFLMLLRYRGEDPDEIAGLVEAARAAAGCGTTPGPQVDLDWPSYGAGRTRGAPWFLLAALALAGAGHRVLMHGSNEFSSGLAVPEALARLGLRPAGDRADAARLLEATGFAYLPLRALSPELDRLLGLRELLGLRSPINTVARLLDPFDARAGVDGVFHPPYIALHLATAERLGRRRLLVVKGGGGEAERTPLKPVTAHLLDQTRGRCEITLPATCPGEARPPTAEDILAVWRGEAGGVALATVLATLSLALLALDPAAAPVHADARAAEIWRQRGGI
ncbi:glycosyl transferase family protein [Roseomonas sp. E05]|uniref:glycosyl transferase family protein n=1 Tax=Roseomonas sp. E05 TaxID=3046310 RepID=UPI0024BB2E69|nr:glycosyl transferase family protein [Roseomonas sp. E05]MDJ0391345.1 glycosyl transferase family protein [Roseomonas sp. E05]